MGALNTAAAITNLSVSGLAATSQYRRVGASSGLVCEMSWPTDTETGDAG